MKNEKQLVVRVGDKITLSDGRETTIGGFSSGKDIFIIEHDGIKYVKVERPTSYETIYTAPKETKFKVGDIVEVIDSGECYENYANWVLQNYGQYKYLNKYFTYGKCVKNEFVGKIVGIGKDAWDSNIIYAIRSHDELYLIGEHGIKKTDKQLDILYAKEKEFLSAVIKPFRDKVEYIEKKSVYFDTKSFIVIKMDGDCIIFPYFDTKSMYIGMEDDRKYTLKELGL